MLDQLNLFSPSIPLTGRISIIVGTAVLSHLLVHIVRRLSNAMMSAIARRRLRKARAVNTLITSVIVFAIYFGAVGIALTELGVSLTAYLASASVIGLAVGFGSQGVVQDVVSGLTIVLADLYDVGDMVKIGDDVGIVKEIAMRFTVLENALGARVMIPNRSITNVARFPRGYVRAIVDVTIPDDPETAQKSQDKARALVKTAVEQYANVFRAEPEDLGLIRLPSGRTIYRTKFRIWPGRGAPLETSFRQEIIAALKALNENYEDWMVTVNYEVEAPSKPRDVR